jgi:hypothetical protein
MHSRHARNLYNPKIKIIFEIAWTLFEIILFIHFYPLKQALGRSQKHFIKNIIRGHSITTWTRWREGGQKMSVFVHAQGIKTVHAGVKTWQNSVHVVVECPLMDYLPLQMNMFGPKRF